MRSLALTVLTLVTLNIFATPPASATPAIPTRSVLSQEHISCIHGYRCRTIHAQLCVAKAKGQSVWTISHRDVHLRRGTSSAGCNAYAVGIKFELRFNGRLAALQAHSLKCSVQAQHTVSVMIEKCYSLVQKTARKKFSDVVSGARVCIRTLGSRRRGCHQEYAVNIYARANGHVTGEAWLGSRVYAPRL